MRRGCCTVRGHANNTVDVRTAVEVAWHTNTIHMGHSHRATPSHVNRVHRPLCTELSKCDAISICAVQLRITSSGKCDRKSRRSKGLMCKRIQQPPASKRHTLRCGAPPFGRAGIHPVWRIRSDCAVKTCVLSPRDAGVDESQLVATPLPPFFLNGAKSGFEMCFGPSTLGAGAITRLGSRIKKLTPHWICRPRQCRRHLARDCFCFFAV